MRRFPGLGHQPDIVLEGFDGRDSYTILEVKTCEPAGDAYIARQQGASMSTQAGTAPNARAGVRCEAARTSLSLNIVVSCKRDLCFKNRS